MIDGLQTGSIQWPIAGGVALTAALVLTPLVRRLAVTVGMVDRPGPRKIHHVPMPLLGGLAIAAASIGAAAVALDRFQPTIVVLAAGAVMLLTTGILDDRGLLHHQIKLMGVMPLAAATLIASAYWTDNPISLTQATGSLTGIASASDAALTLLWIVGITAAFNILDHMDGLAAGVAAIAACFICWFAVREGNAAVATASAALLGGSIGFLKWNFNPAQIFMGDGGAMFLGFTTGTLAAMLGLPEASAANRWLIPVFILAVPVFDTMLVSISRTRRGLLPFAAPGKDHTAHRLVVIGLTQPGAVVSLYILGAAGGATALIVEDLSPVPAYVVAASSLAAGLCAVVWLERVGYERQHSRALAQK